MRLLGIDAGEKRIGLALSDRLLKTASPHTTLPYDESLKENLLKIIRLYEVKKIIIGIPYNLKGEKGHQAEKVEDFIKKNISGLAAEEGIEIIRIDERFTSKISNILLKEKCGNKTGGHATSTTDSVSAAILLNDYIERKKTVEHNKKTQEQ